DARRRTVSDQPAGFGELGRGAFALALDAIGGGEKEMGRRVCRIGAARLFKPSDRFVGARLQQMRMPDHTPPRAEVGIARTEADGLLDERDHLLDRPGIKLALPETGI